MDMRVKEDFLRLWTRYFNNMALPLAFYYANGPIETLMTANQITSGRRSGLTLLQLETETQTKCVIEALAKVRKGKTVILSIDSLKCTGGKLQLGFADLDNRPFSEQYRYSYRDYFISDGIPGMIEGERLKKDPGLCREINLNTPLFKAPGEYCVFKRFDQLSANDPAAVVVFFAKPDVLAALYNLVNFDSADLNAVIAPWGTGCYSIVTAPYEEVDSATPKAVLGMLNTVPRSFIGWDEFSFAVPMSLFKRMVDQMEESFISNEAWAELQKRI